MSAHADRIREQKTKIRERYKGISEDKLDLIPALPTGGLDDQDQTKRVAVYARVSTDDPRQTSSYELQKNHYQDVISRHVNWQLTEIYADEGISGTSLSHRDSFLRMIRDCEEGKIDLILTKSVSRFARNIVDCISHIRHLRAMKPPIGVLFETEHIYTLDSNSDMSLSFIATLAQEESHTKSEIMNSSIEMRFRRGIFLTPPLLGYDRDEDGMLVINEEEALTVRLIFFLYLYGYSCQEIADRLISLKRRTKAGNYAWYAASILDQLQNERHCGDVRARKTFTPNYLDHKSKKNRQDRNQYLQRDHHEAIVSRDDFIAVQHLIRNAKYKHKGILPALSVIPDGILKGFVVINPRWAGFKDRDYMEASGSVFDEKELTQMEEIKAKRGEFDLRGYEVANASLFETGKRISVLFTQDNLTFSSEAITRMQNTEYVELLVHPMRRYIAVRKCEKTAKCALKWIRILNDHYAGRRIPGSAFLPNLYDLFSWKKAYSYKVGGFRLKREEDAILLFDLDDATALIPKRSIEDEKGAIGNGRHVFGFPSGFEESFGQDYYRQVTLLKKAEEGEDFEVGQEGEMVRTGEKLAVRGREELDREIKNILERMREEADSDYV